MAYLNLMDALQPQTFFPYRYRQPQRALVIFKPVAGDPGGASGKLNCVENNKDVTQSGLAEKTWKWRKIGLVGG